MLLLRLGHHRYNDVRRTGHGRLRVADGIKADDTLPNSKRQFSNRQYDEDGVSCYLRVVLEQHQHQHQHQHQQSLQLLYILYQIHQKASVTIQYIVTYHTVNCYILNCILLCTIHYIVMHYTVHIAMYCIVHIVTYYTVN